MTQPMPVMHCDSSHKGDHSKADLQQLLGSFLDGLQVQVLALLLGPTQAWSLTAEVKQVLKSNVQIHAFREPVASSQPVCQQRYWATSTSHIMLTHA